MCFKPLTPGYMVEHQVGGLVKQATEGVGRQKLAFADATAGVAANVTSLLFNKSSFRVFSALMAPDVL